MNALEEEIRAQIATYGPMPLDRYMQLALSHPVHGYYMRRDPFGAAGDFITAPEISQMFGELLGLWAVEMWLDMGRPSPVRLVELGPGRGTLMHDALRAARVMPDFCAALDVHMVETSPLLQARQKQNLSQVQGWGQVPASWHGSVTEVPDGAAIIFANEFFDALPVRHHVRTERGWCERLVGLDATGGLTFGLAANPEPAWKMEAPNGTVLETNITSLDIMSKIATRLQAQNGALLMIDYGYSASSFGETFQAVQNHQYTHPLNNPGEADLTAHVDFAALGRIAALKGASVNGPITQGAFLSALGLFERAAALRKKATPVQAEALDSALIRLAGVQQEGEPAQRASGPMNPLFKVMGVCRAGLPPMPGFSAVGVMQQTGAYA